MNTYEAAKISIASCMGVKAGEKFLILTDIEQLDLAKEFVKAGNDLGIETIMAVGPVHQGGEMPQLCKAALDEAQVCMMITTGSYTHTKGRAEATERGCRIASMPGITEDIVKMTLGADYDEVERIGNILAEKLTRAEKIHIITEAGTDLTLYCGGREGIADTGKLTESGAFGNLPAGEAMVAPIETKGNGVLVVDGVIADFKVMEEPLTLTFADGRIVKTEGADAEMFEEFVGQFEDTAKNVCEFGIGTNPTCEIMGNGLVDEKVFGTIHIACGNNLFMGGQQDCDMHYDMIINAPTVWIDDECVMEKGKHVY
ncbi:aminopeptidase [Senimuribacter intestinalis]|uniref:aminopeptidase n=1 Tax=Senimuribacter intestinalis TaxID=2941507 RepID=UPI002042285D|nr:aminopeptidase [Senimuribacter intestinalis]